MVPGTIQHLKSHLPNHQTSSTYLRTVKSARRALMSIGVSLTQLPKDALQIISLPSISGSSQIDIELDQTTKPIVPFGPNDSRNLLLCISSLRPSHYKTIMRPVNITNTDDDESLFLALKAEYKNFVGRLRWWFSMRTIVGARFVHVNAPPPQSHSFANSLY